MRKVVKGFLGAGREGNMRVAVWIGRFGALACAQPGLAQTQKNYGPGVTDTEIKIGQTMPFSGPASSFGLNGKVEAAYCRMISEKGGVKGVKINLRALDLPLLPPKPTRHARIRAKRQGAAP